MINIFTHKGATRTNVVIANIVADVLIMIHKDLKKIIDKKRDEYPLMQENIIKFRESFCYENRVNDLLKEIV